MKVLSPKLFTLSILLAALVLASANAVSGNEMQKHEATESRYLRKKKKKSFTFKLQASSLLANSLNFDFFYSFRFFFFISLVNIRMWTNFRFLVEWQGCGWRREVASAELEEFVNGRKVSVFCYYVVLIIWPSTWNWVVRAVGLGELCFELGRELI